jgi:hypothetical protein
MVVPAPQLAPSEESQQYMWLEQRPDSWRKQLYLKGRNVSAGQLIYSMRANGTLNDPARAAQTFALPAEQVQEALTYYRRHRSLIEAEADAEKRWLLEQGYTLEPTR